MFFWRGAFGWWRGEILQVLHQRCLHYLAGCAKWLLYLKCGAAVYMFWEVILHGEILMDASEHRFGEGAKSHPMSLKLVPGARGRLIKIFGVKKRGVHVFNFSDFVHDVFFCVISFFFLFTNLFVIFRFCTWYSKNLALIQTVKSFLCNKNGKKWVTESPRKIFVRWRILNRPVWKSRNRKRKIFQENVLRYSVEHYTMKYRKRLKMLELQYM